MNTNTVQDPSTGTPTSVRTIQIRKTSKHKGIWHGAIRLRATVCLLKRLCLQNNAPTITTTWTVTPTAVWLWMGISTWLLRPALTAPTTRNNTSRHAVLLLPLPLVGMTPSSWICPYVKILTPVWMTAPTTSSTVGVLFLLCWTNSSPRPNGSISGNSADLSPK